MGAFRGWFVVAVLLVAGVVGSLVAGGSTAAPGGRWVVRDLGARYGIASGDGSLSFPAAFRPAINERGQVVGTSDKSGHSRAFFWEQGRLRDLGVLSGDTDSRAVAVNDRGQIVVLSWKGYGDAGHAFLWENGRILRLPALTANGTSAPVDINELGQVVGSAQGRAVLWTQGRIRSLGPGEAVAINDQSQIVGWSPSDDGLGQRMAFLWQNGTTQGLTAPSGGKYSDAADLNERGQIVGALSGPTGWNGPFIWQKGTISAIRVSHPYLFEPLAINDRGQVALTGAGEWILWQAGKTRYHGKGDALALNERGQVAISLDDGQKPAPRLWANGSTTKLPLLPGGEGGGAITLNERNQIVGSSCTFHSAEPKHSWWDCHYVLWTWQPA